MFTGIIETTAKILDISPAGLTIERPESFDDIKTGASICVSGVCLSIVNFNDSSMSFDVVKETWNKTNLGALMRGDYVNLERSLKADGRFEGHVVQGHVEGTADVASIENDSHGATLTLALPENLATLVVPKGSICVDGVSLTIATVQGDSCTIALIPHTREQTTLGDLQAGDSVNIETDILGRYILASLSKRI